MIERQPSFGRYERNIQKFQQVKEFWDEFNERSILVKQSICTLTEELKVDLTVKFTKFIQMQLYEALNQAYTIEDFGSKSELSQAFVETDDNELTSEERKIRLP